MTTARNMFSPQALRGVIPPLVTPFDAEGRLDRAALHAEIGFMVDCGVSGIVVGGSTGEGSSLREGDVEELVSESLMAAGGRIPVIAGIIARTCEEAVRMARAAERGGACGLQVPPPYFEFTTDPAILGAYYSAITDATGLPLIIYNVIPWAQLAIEGLEKILDANPKIFGIKQSGRNIHGLANLAASPNRRFRLYTAIDDLLYPSFMLGVDGTISGTSSLLPRQTTELMLAVETGDYARALNLHERILPLWRLMDTPDFPSRIKYAMRCMGRSPGYPRSPFGWPSAEVRETIERALSLAGLLSESDQETTGVQPITV
jgi:4-hydroxy-tetrahydrodipicolinate synthase